MGGTLFGCVPSACGLFVGCLEAEPVLLSPMGCCAACVPSVWDPVHAVSIACLFWPPPPQGHYERREGSSLVTVQGYIFQAEHAMEPENAVGFFSLVTATDDLPSEDYDVTKPSAD